MLRQPVLCRQILRVYEINCKLIETIHTGVSIQQRPYGGLSDYERIFTNLYGRYADWI